MLGITAKINLNAESLNKASKWAVCDFVKHGYSSGAQDMVTSNAPEAQWLHLLYRTSFCL